MLPESSGQVANNNAGVAGMAQIQLMAVKVMNDSGEGTDTYVSSGIRWAVDNGADVITMSLGVDGASTTLGNMVNYASNHGVVMVAASGNSGSSVVSYPAAYAKVIAVGAVDSSQRRASFSNYGNNLDVMAPGVSIYSTQAGSGYQYLSGTSTAAPYVAGLAALMLTVNPALTPREIGANINSTAQDISISGYDSSTGWGIIDAFSAVEQKSGPTVVYENIGRNIAGLIEDGSSLQMGIGNIPDAVLHYLDGKEDLGIHTEMFSDGVITLVEKGILTNERKTLHQGKIIASFVLGRRKLLDFINNNPLMEFHPSNYTNDPFIIAQNDKMVAINSALQVDLTGQICADSMGPKFYSGFGGQLDFIRGASRSKDGKPIIGIPSTARTPGPMLLGCG